MGCLVPGTVEVTPLRPALSTLDLLGEASREVTVQEGSRLGGLPCHGAAGLLVGRRGWDPGIRPGPPVTPHTPARSRADSRPADAGSGDPGSEGGAERASPRRPGCRKDTCSPQLTAALPRAPGVFLTQRRGPREPTEESRHENGSGVYGEIPTEGGCPADAEKHATALDMVTPLRPRRRASAVHPAGTGSRSARVPPTKLVLLPFLPCVPGN